MARFGILTHFSRSSVPTLLVIMGLGVLGVGLVATNPLSSSAETSGIGPETSSQPQGTLQVKVSDHVKQGETLRITLQNPPTPGKWTASMAGRTIALFPQSDGTVMGVMPVYVAQKIGTYPLSMKGPSGTPQYETPIAVVNGNYRKQNISVSKSMAGLQPLPGELEAVAALKTTVTGTRYWSEPLIKPTPDCMNSPFGNLRLHNGKFTDEYHKGVDQRSPAGRPVVAIAGGKVQIAKAYRLHGNTVGLDHGQGMTSIYIHMSKLAVKEGDTVTQGQTIGYVGSTGFATGPHLHWGLFVNGVPVNPLQWIKTISAC